MNEGTEINKLLELSVFCMSDKELEKAFYKLVSALMLNPESKHLLKAIFQDTLAIWGRSLESQGSYDKLFSSYETALQIFCDHEGILSNLGAHLFRAGYVENASVYFKQALKINKDYIPALRNLESAFNLWIERWHYRMLNDKVRNSSFRKAIFKKIKQGYTSVLDIGTGTGILSLFAVEAGAQEMYACEVSKTMTNIAENVLEQNNVGEKVKLVNKLSNDIKIPTDIPHRISLVVTETVDIGLVGENILQTVIHAWDNLLLPCTFNQKDKSSYSKEGCVIPHSAVVWVAAVECSHINLKYRFQGTDKEETNVSKSFTFTNFLNFNLFALDHHEYDSIDLEKVPQGFRYLTKPVVGMTINFNDRNSLVDLFKGTDTAPLHLTSCSKGRLDAFILWFDLFLDETTQLSSAPVDIANRAKCWDQAVFPLQKPQYVMQNEILLVTVQCLGGKMSVKFHCNETTAKQMKIGSKSTKLATTRVNCEKSFKKKENKDVKSYKVSTKIISYLNDENLMMSANSIVQTFMEKKQITTSTRVLDISPFPLFGMAFLLLRKKITGLNNFTLTCTVEEEKDKAMLRSLANVNAINESQLNILDDMEEVLAGKQAFDYIFYHPVDACGKLNEKIITNLPLLSQLTTQSDHIFPKEIIICCQLIHSQWLLEVSEVLEDRTCGFCIGPHINKYKVSEHPDVMLSTIGHSIYSEVIETPYLNLELLMKSLREPLVFKIVTSIKNNGSINAIPYWFKIKYNAHEVTTISNTSFSNQSIILLDTPLYVHSGEHVNVNVICHQGLIHATVGKEM